MDSKLFRLPTQPNFYAAIATASPFDLDSRQKFTQIPAPDNRYPGWAGPMADGRLVTSYQNHCSRNVPAGRQFATKEWMTKNATELIRLGRQRFAQQTGAIYGVDAGTVPPPAAVVTCARHDCERVATDAPGGIGQERGDSPAPELFGTWDPRQGRMTAPQALASVTRKYEGGRNTPRGSEMR
jgi:hypothetical protein